MMTNLSPLRQALLSDPVHNFYYKFQHVFQNPLINEVIAKFQKAQDFFSEAEDKKEALLCKIR